MNKSTTRYNEIENKTPTQQFEYKQQEKIFKREIKVLEELKKKMIGNELHNWRGEGYGEQ